jgi:cardiolipin synthase
MVRKKLKKFLNLPNILTLLRLTASPIIFYLIWIDRKNMALFLFILAVLSDKADGYIARKRKQETAFGETIDPIADNTLIMLTAIALVIKNVVNPYFLKYALIIFLIFIVSIVIYGIKLRKVRVPKLMIGKINIVALYILIIYIFLGLPVGKLFINIALIYSFIVSLKYLIYSIKVKKAS